MRRLLIINPHARGAGEAENLLEAARRAGVEVAHLGNDDQERRLAAIDGTRYDRIICAGGDGTLHDVVNRLWKRSAGKIPVAVGLVPMGTGNDLARTLDLPSDPLEAFEFALQGGVREIDLIEVRMAEESALAVNACAGGFASSLTEHMTSNRKRIWGPVAYLLGAASSISEVEEYTLELSFDGGPFQRIDALNVVVANGRTAGGGAPAAPRARPADGLLDVVVVRRAATPALAALAARMIAGDYLNDDLIVFRRARTLDLHASTDLRFNADGEVLPAPPHSFGVLPEALPIVAQR